MSVSNAFVARVNARCGREFHSIPAVAPEELLGGHIVACEGNIYVFFVGPEAREEDGIPYWDPDAARRTTL